MSRVKPFGASGAAEPGGGPFQSVLRALGSRLTLGGRLRLVQPVAPLAGALALALALVFPARWLLYLAYVFLILTVGAYLWIRSVGPGLSLRRTLRTTWAQVGDELEEDWELENRAPLPLLGLEIEDGSTLPGYSARRVIDAEAGEHFGWRTTARCTRRGRYRLGPLDARCVDPVGLFRYQWREEATRQLVVYPPLVRLPPLAAPNDVRGGPRQAPGPAEERRLRRAVRELRAHLRRRAGPAT